MDSTQNHVVAHRLIPTAAGEGIPIAQRGSPYGEAVMVGAYGSKMYVPGEEGRYFLGVNPTPGTGIAGHAAPTTIDNTKPLVFLRNNAAMGSNRRVFLDYIKLLVTAAGTNGTNVRYACKVDSGGTRFSSGPAVTAIANACIGSGETPQAELRFGAVVATAATAAVRLLNHGIVRPVITVVEDIYLFTFGQSEKRLNALAPGGTAIANVEINCVPICLDPQTTFLLHIASASQSAASSYEYEVGWFER